MNKKEIFIYFASPEHWFQTALELNDTIDELISIKEKAYYIETFHLNIPNFKRPFCSKAIYLLMSFALENIIKGIVVLRNPEYVNTGTLKKEIKSHNLIELIQIINFSLLVRENNLLKKLTHIGTSTARYPIGLNEHYEILPVKFIDADEVAYKKLFIKLRDILANEFHQKGWNSGLKNTRLNTKPKEFKFLK